MASEFPAAPTGRFRHLQVLSKLAKRGVVAFVVCCLEGDFLLPAVEMDERFAD